MTDVPPPSMRDIAAALEALPVFPLPQTVLFPGALLPLHIFEPRYRVMVKDALSTNKVLAIALIRETGERDPHRNPHIEPVAGVGIIIDHAELADGRYNILLRGRARVQLEELPFVPPYRRARATLLHAASAEPPSRDVAALLASAAAFAADIRARDPEFDFRIPAHAPAGAACDLAAHHLVLDARERQAILETLDVTVRLRRTTESLALQHAALQGNTRGPMN
ncbi:MAG TPA: LON peptidase substrate-binding domain-containing protein [Polyangiaceae bacterium]|nr:LON peptidase substrate-binding domain-containing protein [Polyangiaceae bacterium]